mgnify:CR=1 FL=1
MPAIIDDTYAEAFRSIYAEVLITARDRVWLDHAVQAVTGNASSSILCDCEAGLDRYVDSGTPDGRPGAVVQFHVPRFHKDRAQRLERSLLVRLSQNVLTCPTAACFNVLDEPTYFKLGRKIAFFGDGFQFRDTRFGRRVCCGGRSRFLGRGLVDHVARRRARKSAAAHRPGAAALVGEHLLGDRDLLFLAGEVGRRSELAAAVRGPRAG